ncbi:MAG: diguanylate cyclase [Anaerolineaceae bacterium]|nr:diguanylate cyclase [Anaerolineaceae bacterium]
MSDLIHLLYVDSNPSDRKAIKRVLQTRPGLFELTTTTTPKAFQKKIGESEYDLGLVDLEAFGNQGLQLLKTIREHQSELPVVVLTGNSSVQLAVDAIKNGAADYLLKTPADIERLPQTLQEINRLAQQAKIARIAMENFKRITNNNVDAVYSFLITEDNNYVEEWASNAKELNLGYTKQELNERGGWISLIHQEDLPVIEQIWEAILAGQLPERDEIRVINRSNETRWLRFLIRSEWNEDHSRIKRVVVGTHDITHHKRVGEQLNQTERKYHRLVEQIKAVIYTSSSSGISSPLYVSPQVKDLLGYSANEWVSDPSLWLKLIHPGDRETVLAEFEHANQTSEPFDSEYRMIGRDGRVVWIHDGSQPVKDELGQIQYWNGFIYDITERKLSEEALTRRAKELQALYETFLEINSQKNLNKLLQSIVSRSASLLGAQMGGLYMVRPGGDSLELVINYNLPDDYVGTILKLGEGLSGRILQNGQPLMIEDHSHWAGRTRPFSRSGIKRVLGLPLKIGERIIGIINVADNVKTGPFDEDEIRLVSLFADQAAIAIENTRLYEASQREIKDRIQAEQALQEIQIQLANRIGDLEQRSHEITHLSQLSNLLQLSLQPNEAYSIISQYATQLFPNASGALFTLDDQQQDLNPRTNWGQPPVRVSSLTHDDCWALRRNRPYLAVDTSNGMLCRHISAPLPGSYLCVPILSEGQEIGLLYLQTNPGQPALTSAQQQLATAVAEQAGLALSNLQLREYLRTQAISDPLTGLFNRYYLQEYLDMKIRLAKQDGKPVNVILIDLDDFKAMNEKFGYSTGDELLRKFGKIVKQAAEKTGIACRYVGDALTLIMPEISLQESKRKSEHLRREIKKLMVRFEDHFLQNLTVSIGIACFPEHGHSVAELLKAAGMAAQRAKEMGGDQVVIAAPYQLEGSSTPPV